MHEPNYILSFLINVSGAKGLLTIHPDIFLSFAEFWRTYLTGKNASCVPCNFLYKSRNFPQGNIFKDLRKQSKCMVCLCTSVKSVKVIVLLVQNYLRKK